MSGACFDGWFRVSKRWLLVADETTSGQTERVNEVDWRVTNIEDQNKQGQEGSR